jgi:hypothetical protein
LFGPSATPLKTKGIFKFLHCFGPDEIGHGLATGESSKDVAARRNPKSARHARLTDNRRFPGVVQNVALNIDTKVLLQLTTDGMHGYPNAVAKHFGENVDYGVLNKTYAAGPALYGDFFRLP